jgi:hypothetical protein
MNWVNIKDNLPDKLSHPYDQCGNDMTSLVVCGYDVYNYTPRYKIYCVNEIAEIKPDKDNRYIIGNLMIHSWLYLNSPIREEIQKINTNKEIMKNTNNEITQILLSIIEKSAQKVSFWNTTKTERENFLLSEIINQINKSICKPYFTELSTVPSASDINNVNLSIKQLDVGYLNFKIVPTTYNQVTLYVE